MKDTSRTLLITGGLALITVAITPTPDDITVISPLIQLALGMSLIIYGTVAK